MKFAGISGSIGSGKSTVAAMLAARGAHIIDADALNRVLQAKGQPLFDRIVGRWGRSVVGSDGELDRQALAAIVFSDAAQLGELTLMAAPFTEDELVRRARVHLGTDDVVIAEAAMYLRPSYGMGGLIVVDTPEEAAIARLVRQRGMRPDEAVARLRSQLPRESRLAEAGFVIDNSGDIGALTSQVDAAWSWIRSLPDATPRVER